MVHDYEDNCENCDIKKKFDPVLPACDAPICNGTSTTITNAYAALTSASAGCLTSCTATCGASFRILRAAHDACDENDITTDIEKAIHDYEDVCKTQSCNVGKASDPVPPVCPGVTTTIAMTQQQQPITKSSSSSAVKNFVLSSSALLLVQSLLIVSVAVLY